MKMFTLELRMKEVVKGWKVMSLPEERKLITVNRSHFVHKKARDQFFVKSGGKRLVREVVDLEALRGGVDWSVERRRRGMWSL